MHNLNWEDLQYILAVYETGSLSGAARRLGVNHATVLRRITKVEGQWQRPLFQKTQKGTVLDPSARDIIAAGRPPCTYCGRPLDPRNGDWCACSN